MRFGSSSNFALWVKKAALQHHNYLPARPSFSTWTAIRRIVGRRPRRQACLAVAQHNLQQSSQRRLLPLPVPVHRLPLHLQLQPPPSTAPPPPTLCHHTCHCQLLHNFLPLRRCPPSLLLPSLLTHHHHCRLATSSLYSLLPLLLPSVSAVTTHQCCHRLVFLLLFLRCVRRRCRRLPGLSLCCLSRSPCSLCYSAPTP